MRQALSIGAAMVAMGLATVPAAAEYPERAITAIVPLNPGGGGDTGVRTWAPYLERCLGGTQPVLVVNLPGGGNVIGFTYHAQQPADGYTIGTLNQPNMSIALVSKPDELQFTLDTFDYYGNFFGNTLVVAVRADSPLQTFDDFIALTKTQPVNTGVTGPGSDDALVVDQLVKQAEGAQIVQIPLGGTAPIINGVLGGHVEAAILTLASVKGSDGQLRPLAVTAAERLADSPDVPTMRESGIDIVSQSAHIVGGLKEIPAEIKEKLVACFDQIRADEAFWAEADGRLLPRLPMTAEEATAYMKSETERLQKLWDEDPWL